MKSNQITKCSKRLPITKSSKLNAKLKDSAVPNIKKISKQNKLVKSSETLNFVNKSNLNNLNSRSVQNLSEIKNDLDTNAIKKHSLLSLNETNKKCATNSKYVDAIKILEFLVQKTKQNNDSKNVTFDSLFNELNLMNKNLANKLNLECSLDIKLDQMENEIEILRAQLNQNSQANHFLVKSPNKMTNTKPDESSKFFNFDDKIEKLQKELYESNKKCQVLEYLLEQKNKQTEKFNFLFK
jgi:hypothetical protein